MKLFALLAAAALIGCRDKEIEVYRVAKDEPAAPVASAPAPASPGDAMGGPMPGLVGSGRMSWDVPKGWEARPAGGPRYATFAAGAAEVSVIVLPGDAGGALANVNRWRGQLALPPIDEQALAAATRRVKSAAGTSRVVEFAGADARSRMAAAILPKGENTWFFKLTGPDDAVKAATPAFLKFLESLR